MLSHVLGMPVGCHSAVSRREPFQEREKARHTDYGTLDVVYVGCVDNNVGPTVAMRSRKVSLDAVGEQRETDLVAPSIVDPKNCQRTAHP